MLIGPPPVLPTAGIASSRSDRCDSPWATRWRAATSLHPRRARDLGVGQPVDHSGTAPRRPPPPVSSSIATLQGIPVATGVERLPSAARTARRPAGTGRMPQSLLSPARNLGGPQEVGELVTGDRGEPRLRRRPGRVVPVQRQVGRAKVSAVRSAAVSRHAVRRTKKPMTRADVTSVEDGEGLRVASLASPSSSSSARPSSEDIPGPAGADHPLYMPQRRVPVTLRQRAPPSCAATPADRRFGDPRDQNHRREGPEA